MLHYIFSIVEFVALVTFKVPSGNQHVKKKNNFDTTKKKSSS